MKRMRTALALLISCALPGGAATPSALADDAVVNVYSARKEALILPALERFREATGIDFNLVTGKADGLLKRLELEGGASPADLFITVDAGRLERAKRAGVLRAVKSEVLEAAIPENLRDADGHWFGLSQRARVAFRVRDRVDAGEVSRYEDLADPRWKGRICVRSSDNIYNQSLVASMIATLGVAETESWARGLTANFARPPVGGDTDQLRAAAAGVCDLAIANTYYFGRLLASRRDEDRETAARLAVVWPNQGEGERGVHVNVSGAGVTAHAEHADDAVRLLEFLTARDSQAWYAEVNNEYPVVADVPVSGALESLGGFRADALDLTELGENNRRAVELMDRAGWR